MIAFLAAGLLAPAALAQEQRSPVEQAAPVAIPEPLPVANPPPLAAPAPSAPIEPATSSDEDQLAAPHNLAPAMHELSPWSMFIAADIVVKAVMIGLAFASLVTWTIFLAKSLEIARARLRLRAALQRLGSVRFLTDAQRATESSRGVVPTLIAAALGEMRLSADLADGGGVQARAASAMSEVAKAEARAIRRGMGLLATIGSTAPFVGLFGTVWGIMNSFIGISKAQTTNLAVVAPGIAEALLATAIGLVAAIPAVVIYNVFARQTKAYVDLVGDAMGRTERLLSRDLDRGQSASLARAAG